MALSTKKKHVRFAIDVKFASKADKCSFNEKLSAVRNRLYVASIINCRSSN